MQHKLEFNKSAEDNSYQNDVQPMVLSYAIALITVGCVVLVILILFFIYFKYYRNKTRPQNHNTKPTKTMEAAWPNSEDPNMDYVTYDIKNNSENFNSDAKQSELKFESSMIEKPYDTQEYSTHSPGTTNTSTTL
jgi:flagellar biosynthesis/type III secretory pathway M-ring protein FliF/YscJ